ncbi:MAG: hypothetical protein ACRYFW_14900 [Janthinobacterium lividum]
MSMHENEADKPNDKHVADQAGEDDGSTSVEGKDDHLKDDQKPTTK